MFGTDTAAARRRARSGRSPGNRSSTAYQWRPVKRAGLGVQVLEADAEPSAPLDDVHRQRARAATTSGVPAAVVVQHRPLAADIGRPPSPRHHGSKRTPTSAPRTTRVPARAGDARGQDDLVVAGRCRSGSRPPSARRGRPRSASRRRPSAVPRASLARPRSRLRNRARRRSREPRSWRRSPRAAGALPSPARCLVACR